MSTDSLNASLCAAQLTGHINGMIRIASDKQDYETCIMHLRGLIRAFTNNEFNQACHEWLRDWNNQIEKYERLQIERTAR
jgi:hypothetical protein